MPQRRLIFGETLITSTRPERIPMPRTYSADQYNAACELLIKAHTAYVRLKAEHERLKGELQTMRAKQKTPVQIYETFDAPDTGRLVVEERKRRGLM